MAGLHFVGIDNFFPSHTLKANKMVEARREILDLMFGNLYLDTEVLSDLFIDEENHELLL